MRKSLRGSSSELEVGRSYTSGADDDVSTDDASVDELMSLFDDGGGGGGSAPGLVGPGTSPDMGDMTMMMPGGDQGAAPDMTMMMPGQAPPAGPDYGMAYPQAPYAPSAPPDYGQAPPPPDYGQAPPPDYGQAPPPDYGQAPPGYPPTPYTPDQGAYPPSPYDQGTPYDQSGMGNQAPGTQPGDPDTSWLPPPDPSEAAFVAANGPGAYGIRQYTKTGVQIYPPTMADFQWRFPIIINQADVARWHAQNSGPFPYDQSMLVAPDGWQVEQTDNPNNLSPATYVLPPGNSEFWRMVDPNNPQAALDAPDPDTTTDPLLSTARRIGGPMVDMPFLGGGGPALPPGRTTPAGITLSLGEFAGALPTAIRATALQMARAAKTAMRPKGASPSALPVRTPWRTGRPPASDSTHRIVRRRSRGGVMWRSIPKYGTKAHMDSKYPLRGAPPKRPTPPPMMAKRAGVMPMHMPMAPMHPAMPAARPMVRPMAAPMAAPSKGRGFYRPG